MNMSSILSLVAISVFLLIDLFFYSLRSTFYCSKNNFYLVINECDMLYATIL